MRAYLSRDQATALRKQVQRHAAWLGKLIYRCREVQMYESDPILFAALKPARAVRSAQHRDRACSPLWQSTRVRHRWPAGSRT
jgi:hypothetical protein